MAKSTERPCCASSRMAVQNERRPSTSMPVVGSSSSSRAGSESRAIANRSRCCSPPEHLATLRFAICAMPALSSTASTGLVSAKRLAVYCTVSRTLRSLSSPPVCMTAATRPRAMACRGAMPNTSTRPAVGWDRPSTMSIVVVLPAPFGPRKATISPGWISRSIPRTACTSPKVFVTPSSRTTGVVRVVMRHERGGRGVVALSWSAQTRGPACTTHSLGKPACPSGLAIMTRLHRRALRR